MTLLFFSLLFAAKDPCGINLEFKIDETTLVWKGKKAPAGKAIDCPEGYEAFVNAGYACVESAAMPLDYQGILGRPIQRGESHKIMTRFLLVSFLEEDPSALISKYGLHVQQTFNVGAKVYRLALTPKSPGHAIDVAKALRTETGKVRWADPELVEEIGGRR